MERYITCYTCTHEHEGYCLIGVLLGVQKEKIIDKFKVMKAEDCWDYRPKRGLMFEGMNKI